MRLGAKVAWSSGRLEMGTHVDAFEITRMVR